MILPTFCCAVLSGQACVSWRGVSGALRGRRVSRRQRRQSSEAGTSPLRRTERTPVGLDRGHTGLVVEASDVRADQRGDTSRRTVPARARRRYGARYGVSGPGGPSSGQERRDVRRRSLSRSLRRLSSDEVARTTHGRARPRLAAEAPAHGRELRRGDEAAARPTAAIAIAAAAGARRSADLTADATETTPSSGCERRGPERRSSHRRRRGELPARRRSARGDASSSARSNSDSSPSSSADAHWRARSQCPCMYPHDSSDAGGVQKLAALNCSEKP